MSENKPVTMTIIVTKKSADVLKKMIKGLDNSFAPMGAGGYSVHEHKEMENSFIFRECDCAPARSYLVGIKDGEIWTVDLAHYLTAFLVSEKIVFTLKYRRFPDTKKARKAFQS